MPELDWNTLVQSASADCRRLLADVAHRDAALLADAFYATMERHPQAAPFWTNNVVHDRLHASMMRWVQ